MTLFSQHITSQQHKLVLVSAQTAIQESRAQLLQLCLRLSYLTTTGKGESHNSALAKCTVKFRSSIIIIFLFYALCCIYVFRLMEIRSRLYELLTHCIPPDIILKVSTGFPINQTSLKEHKMQPVSKLSRALWQRGGKRKERLQLRLWNLNFASNFPVAPCQLSCQISANQHEAETSANVNKH